MPANPTTYAMFERILREAPPATTYECVIPVTYTHGPNAGLTLDRHRNFGGDEFDQLPWSRPDAIGRVEWQPTDALSAPGKGNFVAIGVTHDGGIWVQSCFLDYGSHSVGVRGTMPGDRSGLDMRDPQVMRRHVFDSEDEVVAKVLELIAERDYPVEDDYGYDPPEVILGTGGRFSPYLPSDW